MVTSSKNCDTRHLGWNLSSMSTVPFLGAKVISFSGHRTTVPGSARVGSVKLVNSEKVAEAKLWLTMCTLFLDTCPILIAPKLHTLFFVPVTSSWNEKIVEPDTTLTLFHKKFESIQHYEFHYEMPQKVGGKYIEFQLKQMLRVGSFSQFITE